MPRIELNTEINAPINVVFDLSRSIDFHLRTTEKTGEKAISGKTSGLIGLNESVTWRAKHFGVTQNLTSKITVMQRPDIFVDEMTQGIFKSMCHQHLFLQEDKKTIMIDIFEFESPLGVLGRFANHLYLRKYLKGFLLERNEQIRAMAEGEEWQEFVSTPL
ncbi:SRPBCC family protein [bacterium]|nr:SRPBCC family protein [bacterium]